MMSGNYDATKDTNMTPTKYQNNIPSESMAEPAHALPEMPLAIHSHHYFTTIGLKHNSTQAHGRSKSGLHMLSHSSNKAEPT